MKRHPGVAYPPVHSPSRALVVSAPAKLNLFLDILCRRPDGYHGILTLFERISLADTLRLTPLMVDTIVIDSPSPEIPLDRRNLAYQAAELLKRTQGVARGVRIEIKKNIPVGSGLGGGSSNAASVLLGLNDLFGLRLSQKTLIAYANRIGSDVAFFVSGRPFAIGRGRGGTLTRVRVPDRLRLWHVLFVPCVRVMTKDVYERWDEEAKKGAHLSQTGKSLRLTKKAADVKILLSLIRTKRVLPLNRRIYNGLSETVMKSYGLVSELKDELLASGVEHVHMSGSGCALFTIHRTHGDAKKLYAMTRRRFSRRCRMFVASTL